MTAMTRAGAPVDVAVLTVSDSRTPETDRSGDTIVDWLTQAGHRLADRKLCKGRFPHDPGDDCGLGRRSQNRVRDRHRGDRRHSTRCHARRRPIPVHEADSGIRRTVPWLSYAEIGTSTIQSRADAGVCGDTIVFLLPGSTGACLLGMEKIILPQLDLNHQPCNLVELLPRIKQEHPPGEGAECSLDHVPLPAGPGEPVRSAKDAEYD
jgi:molybdenum cofactor biosynthesis protein B